MTIKTKKEVTCQGCATTVTVDNADDVNEVGWFTIGIRAVGDDWGKTDTLKWADVCSDACAVKWLAPE